MDSETAEPTSGQVAVFHHRYKHYGGGERVADALADALDADLFSLYVTDDCSDKTPATPLHQEKYTNGLTCRFYRHLPVENVARSIDVEHVDLAGYDTVITTGDYAHFYLPTDEQRHVHYLHTPNRDYFNAPEYHGLAGGRLKAVKTLYFQWLRGRDLDHAGHVDQWICNSEFVADRCRRFYGPPEDDIGVVNPPVDWQGLGEVAPARERADYWVTVGRVVPAKRLDVIVDAFRELDEQFVIAGDGRSRDHLIADAPSNVEFTGYVDDQEKRDLLRHARGFLFAGERECFGMSVAEALSAGTPVIGVNSGNVPNMIRDGANGILTEASPAAFREAIEAARTVDWKYASIRGDAEQYSRARFGDEVRAIVTDPDAVTEVPA